MREGRTTEDAKGRAAILGMARSGRSAARLLLSEGYEVVAFDRDPPGETRAMWKEFEGLGSIEGVWGAHPSQLPEGVVLLVRSPGVPSDVPLLEEARKRRIPVVSELELAFRRIGEEIVAVTGTNGKSTTTAWIAHILREGGVAAVAAGNIGRALGDAVLEEPRGTRFVVEVSSFQLEDVDTFRPQVGVLLNITPDHLDRYRSMDDYARAKWNLFARQTRDDWVVTGAGLTPPAPLAGRPFPFGRIEGGHGVVEEDGRIVVVRDGVRHPLLPARDLPLPGPHNLQNAMAAVAAVSAHGLAPSRVTEGLKTFKALAHRMEPVGTWRGVLWVNDSKATNVDSMDVALRSYTRPVVLIAGGRDKGADFARVAPLVRQRVRAVVLLGEASSTIRGAWPGIEHRMVRDLEEAVRTASELAVGGDVVLLSPGCASQDMFRDYQERGDLFREIARRLHGGSPS